MDKQRRKTYFNNKSYGNNRSKQYSLDLGMRGFLCTCNFREKECVRDAYKILEEFANELYGNDDGNVIKNPRSKDEGKVEQEKITNEIDAKINDDEDISDALNKEIAELKSETDKPPFAKRFQSADVGVKNVTFIRTSLPDPLELALSIIKKLDETKQQRTRFILRLIPIQVVCKTNIQDIKSSADRLFDKYFAQEPKTFSIVFNRHCNDKVQRSEVIEELAGLISEKNPGNKADLTNPDIAVIVEIVRRFCLLSIAPDYFKYKKYNLLELCNVNAEKSKDADISPETTGQETSVCQENGSKKEMDGSETSEVLESKGGEDNVEDA